MVTRVWLRVEGEDSCRDGSGTRHIVELTMPTPSSQWLRDFAASFTFVTGKSALEYFSSNAALWIRLMQVIQPDVTEDHASVGEEYHQSSLFLFGIALVCLVYGSIQFNLLLPQRARRQTPLSY